MTGAFGATSLAARTLGLQEVTSASASVADRPADEVARDEHYWREIQQAFLTDRTMINFNNGASCPSPTIVHEAYKRYLDLTNLVPVHYRALILKNLETVRRGLASELGCDPEEMAITRGASESLQIAQNGIDLDPGDEVLTTEQDYPRMLTTWDQRVQRDGIRVRRINFPVPATEDDLYQRFERAITPRTRVLHFCHLTNLTGQLFPVKRLSRLARERGIVSIVDGAHGFAHFPFTLADLDCDYYGTSLHKWLLAPVGTGFLYVRAERIAKTWPLTAAPAQSDDDIRKFEEIGNSPAGAKAAIAEALAFHHAVGADRKAARLRYITLSWAERLKVHPRVRIYSNLEPGQTWGLACVGIEGVDADKLAAYLWDEHRIIVTVVGRDDPSDPSLSYRGLRVTPNLYTTLQEVDAFASALEHVANHGLPRGA
jgi:selenocysteine lyase/cysteine desulfurase